MDWLLSSRSGGKFHKIRVDLLLSGVRLWLSRMFEAALISASTEHYDLSGVSSSLMSRELWRSTVELVTSQPVRLMA